MPQSHFVTVVQDLRRLAGANPSDGQLLDAFVRFKDEQAFTALVRRHGPLVMGVCRRSLGHEQDAEDAFQATFLALARHSDKIRQRGSLAAWLHGVSYRIAMTAKRTMIRQRNKEQAGARPEATLPGDDLTWGEVRGLLDEEVARLPEAFRTVFVLCCLQERSKPEAAVLLGLKEGTVSSRLARAKERLHEALTKRGVTLSVLMATLGLSQASLGAAVLKATARVAVADAAGASGVVPARVATLADGVTNAMLYAKTKVTAGLVLLVGLLLAPLAAQAPSAPKPDAQARDAKAARNDKPVEQVKGRILDPDGKPVKGAKVYRVVPTDLNAAEPRQPRLLAESDADGRFLVRGPFPAEMGWRNSPPLWLATAPGHGPAVVEEQTPADGKDVVLRLVKDIPVVGRIVNLEGRPVAGVTLQPVALAANDKEDLGEWLKLTADKKAVRLHDALPRTIQAPSGIPGLPARLTTDADGRFRLTGVGRERLVALVISGAKVENDFLFVMTRDGKPFLLPDHPGAEVEHRVHPATFQHAVSPAQPLVGTVRDGATGKPVAGAWIDVGMGPLLREKTGEDGTFRLDSLPGIAFRDSRQREFIVTVLPPTGEPYLPVMKRSALPRRGEPMRFDFTLTRGVWAEGKVMHVLTSKPVRAALEYYPHLNNPQAKSYVNPPSEVFANSQMFFHTKADGSFRIPVLPGKGAIGARGSSGSYLSASSLTPAQVGEYAQLPTNVANLHAVALVDTKESARCDLVVDPGRTLACKIVDTDGKPLAGARVHGVMPHDLWGERALVGAGFTVQAMHPKQSRWLAVIHPERQLGASADVTADEKAPYALRLHPTGTITGRLLDPDGHPWPRQVLSVLFDVPGKDHLMQHVQYTVPTDAEGRFRVEGVLPGLTYQVNVTKKPNDQTIGSVKLGLKLRSGEVKDLGDVKPRMFRE